MWISQIQLQNIKSFADSKVLHLSKGINVFVGKNNTGKSTLVQSILYLQSTNLQSPFAQPKEIRRIGTTESSVRVRLEDIEVAYFNTQGISDGEVLEVTIPLAADALPREFPFTHEAGSSNQASGSLKIITHQEPNNFIFPYTVKRFAQYFNPLSNNNQLQQRYVLESLTQLADKILPFTQITKTGFKEFNDLCQSLLGSPMGIIEGQNGHLPGIYTTKDGSIPLAQMGDGTPHILGLIIQLLNAQNKLFIIEEIENSINPEPLKLLLEQIKRSAFARLNQFLISTHSNIVLQSLASDENCNIFEVTQQQVKAGEIPESLCTQIEKGDVEARRRILVNLGYSLADSDMFDGWLLLEEASAATIIRSFLIPYFAKKLINVLGIIDTKGYNQVTNQYIALYQNFLYLHLTPAYQKRIWVIIDGGDEEEKVIKQLRESYSGWPPEYFDQFNEHDFEKYYPACFQEEVERILNLPTNSNEKKRKRQEEKHNLREKVMVWINEDPDRAVEAFTSSAEEVIAKLKNIESKLLQATG